MKKLQYLLYFRLFCLTLLFYTQQYEARRVFPITFQQLNGPEYTIGGLTSGVKIGELKERLRKKGAGEVAKQTLYYKGKNLENDKTLGDCKITEESTIHLVTTDWDSRDNFNNHDNENEEEENIPYIAQVLHQDDQSLSELGTVRSRVGKVPINLLDTSQNKKKEDKKLFIGAVIGVSGLLSLLLGGAYLLHRELLYMERKRLKRNKSKRR